MVRLPSHRTSPGPAIADKSRSDGGKVDTATPRDQRLTYSVSDPGTSAGRGGHGVLWQRLGARVARGAPGGCLRWQVGGPHPGVSPTALLPRPRHRPGRLRAGGGRVAAAAVVPGAGVARV